MPNFGYHLARAQARAIRAAYRAALPAIAGRTIEPKSSFPFDVFSYSSEADLPEQVASIRSFLRHAGRPKRFVVVSDGSHSTSSLQLLRRLDRCVSIEQASVRFAPGLPAAIQPYLANHPTGKQLALIMSLPQDGPALYVDSDVLFFPGAKTLGARMDGNDAPARYLADCRLSADERLLRTVEERAQPANTGVLVLARKLDWAESIARFLELKDAPTFFTNQTMTHLTMHQNRAQPLDPRKFVLQLDDQFLYADRYANPALVLRHYVNPVRHKFWTSLSRSSAIGA